MRAGRATVAAAVVIRNPYYQLLAAAESGGGERAADSRAHWTSSRNKPCVITDSRESYVIGTEYAVPCPFSPSSSSSVLRIY